MTTIPVNLGERSYDVHAGASLLARAGELIAPFAPTKRVFIVTDQNVAQPASPRARRSLDAAGIKNSDHHAPARREAPRASTASKC